MLPDSLLVALCQQFDFFDIRKVATVSHMFRSAVLHEALEGFRDRRPLVSDMVSIIVSNKTTFSSLSADPIVSDMLSYSAAYSVCRFLLKDGDLHDSEEFERVMRQEQGRATALGMEVGGERQGKDKLQTLLLQVRVCLMAALLWHTNTFALVSVWTDHQPDKMDIALPPFVTRWWKETLSVAREVITTDFLSSFLQFIRPEAKQESGEGSEGNNNFDLGVLGAIRGARPVLNSLTESEEAALLKLITDRITLILNLRPICPDESIIDPRSHAFPPTTSMSKQFPITGIKAGAKVKSLLNQLASFVASSCSVSIQSAYSTLTRRKVRACSREICFRIITRLVDIYLFPSPAHLSVRVPEALEPLQRSLSALLTGPWYHSHYLEDLAGSGSTSANTVRYLFYNLLGRLFRPLRTQKGTVPNDSNLPFEDNIDQRFSSNVPYGRFVLKLIVELLNLKLDTRDLSMLHKFGVFDWLLGVYIHNINQPDAAYSQPLAYFAWRLFERLCSRTFQFYQNTLFEQARAGQPHQHLIPDDPNLAFHMYLYNALVHLAVTIRSDWQPNSSSNQRKNWLEDVCQRDRQCNALMLLLKLCKKTRTHITFVSGSTRLISLLLTNLQRPTSALCQLLTLRVLRRVLANFNCEYLDEDNNVVTSQTPDDDAILHVVAAAPYKLEDEPKMRLDRLVNFWLNYIGSQIILSRNDLAKSASLSETLYLLRTLQSANGQWASSFDEVVGSTFNQLSTHILNTANKAEGRSSTVSSLQLKPFLAVLHTSGWVPMLYPISQISYADSENESTQNRNELPGAGADWRTPLLGRRPLPERQRNLVLGQIRQDDEEELDAFLETDWARLHDRNGQAPAAVRGRPRAVSAGAVEGGTDPIEPRPEPIDDPRPEQGGDRQGTDAFAFGAEVRNGYRSMLQTLNMVHDTMVTAVAMQEQRQQETEEQEARNFVLAAAQTTLPAIPVDRRLRNQIFTEADADPTVDPPRTAPVQMAPSDMESILALNRLLNPDDHRAAARVGPVAPVLQNQLTELNQQNEQMMRDIEDMDYEEQNNNNMPERRARVRRHADRTRNVVTDRTALFQNRQQSVVMTSARIPPLPSHRQAVVKHLLPITEKILNPTFFIERSAELSVEDLVGRLYAYEVRRLCLRSILFSIRDSGDVFSIITRGSFMNIIAISTEDIPEIPSISASPQYVSTDTYSLLSRYGGLYRLTMVESILEQQIKRLISQVEAFDPAVEPDPVLVSSVLDFVSFAYRLISILYCRKVVSVCFNKWPAALPFASSVPKGYLFRLVHQLLTTEVANEIDRQSMIPAHVLNRLSKEQLDRFSANSLGGSRFGHSMTFTTSHHHLLTAMVRAMASQLESQTGSIVVKLGSASGVGSPMSPFTAIAAEHASQTRFSILLTHTVMELLQSERSADSMASRGSVTAKTHVGEKAVNLPRDLVLHVSMLLKPFFDAVVRTHSANQKHKSRCAADLQTLAENICSWADSASGLVSLLKDLQNHISSQEPSSVHSLIQREMSLLALLDSLIDMTECCFRVAALNGKDEPIFDVTVRWMWSKLYRAGSSVIRQIAKRPDRLDRIYGASMELLTVMKRTFLRRSGVCSSIFQFAPTEDDHPDKEVMSNGQNGDVPVEAAEDVSSDTAKPLWQVRNDKPHVTAGEKEWLGVKGCSLQRCMLDLHTTSSMFKVPAKRSFTQLPESVWNRVVNYLSSNKALTIDLQEYIRMRSESSSSTFDIPGDTQDLANLTLQLNRVLVSVPSSSVDDTTGGSLLSQAPREWSAIENQFFNFLSFTGTTAEPAYEHGDGSQNHSSPPFPFGDGNVPSSWELKCSIENKLKMSLIFYLNKCIFECLPYLNFADFKQRNRLMYELICAKSIFLAETLKLFWVTVQSDTTDSHIDSFRVEMNDVIEAPVWNGCQPLEETLFMKLFSSYSDLPPAQWRSLSATFVTSPYHSFSSVLSCVASELTNSSSMLFRPLIDKEIPQRLAHQSSPVQSAPPSRLNSELNSDSAQETAPDASQFNAVTSRNVRSVDLSSFQFIYTINPYCDSSIDLELYRFLGQLIGLAILSGTPFPIELEDGVWSSVLTLDRKQQVFVGRQEGVIDRGRTGMPIFSRYTTPSTEDLATIQLLAVLSAQYQRLPDPSEDEENEEDDLIWDEPREELISESTSLPSTASQPASTPASSSSNRRLRFNRVRSDLSFDLTTSSVPQRKKNDAISLVERKWRRHREDYLLAYGGLCSRDDIQIQCESIREGVLSVLPIPVLLLYPWQALRDRIVPP
eukprot:GILJ01012097.1.p1 GENE.GILJ01012097.1~~GILJ01012097.1.p1  ORF type:complete len:2328 (-),score=369.68 GILJ01012097.1:34-6849(-)